MEPSITMDFSDRYLEAIVGHMLRDNSFFLKCKAYLRMEYFKHPDIADLTKMLFQFHDSLHDNSPFSVGEFAGYIAIRYSADIPSRNAKLALVDRCLASAVEIRLATLTKNMTEFIKTAKALDGLVKIKDMYQKRRIQEVEEGLRSLHQNLSSTYFDKLPEADFSDPKAMYEKQKLDFLRCCTVGHPLFDSLLLNGAQIKGTEPMWGDKHQIQKFRPGDIRHVTTGSLAPGNSTVLIGPTNAGKTTALVTIIAWNILFERDVLFVTHEQREDEIQDKTLRSLTNLRKEDVANDWSPTVQGQMNLASKLLSQRLTYTSYVRAGEMYVESVLAMVRSRQEDRIAKTGKGYDLLVVDYPGKLWSKNFLGRSAKRHEELSYIYDQFVLFAVEHKLHAILPAQTNREGFKVNRGDSDRPLDEADIGQSYDVTTLVDNVITINRSPEDIARGTIRFYVTKCRGQKTKHTFVSFEQFDRNRTHGLNLAAGILGPGKNLDADTYLAMFPDKQPEKRSNL